MQQWSARRNSQSQSRGAWPLAAALSRRQSGRPFRAHRWIGFAAAAVVRAKTELIDIESAERPDRGASNERRFVIKEPLGFSGESGIARIADRDRHIANKARAANTLDCALGKQSTEAGAVEPGKFRKLRRAQRIAGGKF